MNRPSIWENVRTGWDWRTADEMHEWADRHTCVKVDPCVDTTRGRRMPPHTAWQMSYGNNADYEMWLACKQEQDWYMIILKSLGEKCA